MHQDGRRLARAGAERGKRAFDLVKVVAVDGDDVEAERLHLRIDRRAVHDLFRRAVDLQTVEVDDNAQVIQLEVRGEHEGLPDLAFLDFAVAQQGIDVDVFIQVFRALGHARRAGNALPQRAGAHIHARNEVHVRVPLQIAVRVAQRPAGRSPGRSRGRPARCKAPARYAPLRAQSGRGSPSSAAWGRYAAPCYTDKRTSPPRERLPPG